MPKKEKSYEELDRELSILILRRDFYGDRTVGSKIKELEKKIKEKVEIWTKN